MTARRSLPLLLAALLAALLAYLLLASVPSETEMPDPIYRAQGEPTALV